MAFGTDQGDKVYLADNERLDKPDYEAAVTFLNATIGRLNGLLVGPLGNSTVPFQGCASPIATTWDGGTKILSIGAGLLYEGGAVTVPASAPAGRVISYDPATAWQLAAGSSVDLTGQAAGSQACVVWAKRDTNTANLDTRKKWAPGAVAESTFGTNTTTREIVAFEVTNATFNGDGQVTALDAPSSSDFFPILKVTAWQAGVPTVGNISVWDGTPTLSLVGDPTTRLDVLGVSDAPSLGEIVYFLRLVLANIVDQDLATSWLYISAAYRGLKQLDTDLATAEATIALVEPRTLSFTIASALVYWNGAAWGFAQSDNFATVTRTGAGVFELQVAAMHGASDFSGVAVLQQTYAAGAVLQYGVVTPPPGGVLTLTFTDTAGTPGDPDNDGFYVTVSGYV